MRAELLLILVAMVRSQAKLMDMPADLPCRSPPEMVAVLSQCAVNASWPVSPEGHVLLEVPCRHAWEPKLSPELSALIDWVVPMPRTVPGAAPRHGASDPLFAAYTSLVVETVIDAVSGACMGAEMPNDAPYGFRNGRALTMLGRRTLDNLVALAEDVVARGVPGGFLEAGVWRGGALAVVAATWKALGEYGGPSGRAIIGADSFTGFPDSTVLVDVNYHNGGKLPTGYFGQYSRKGVLRALGGLGLASPTLSVLEGYFEDTLPAAAASGVMGPLAILRLDGDLFKSTADTLAAAYPLLSPGGWVIADDVTAYVGQRAALVHFFASRGEALPQIYAAWHDLGEVPGAVYFRKPGGPGPSV